MDKFENMQQNKMSDDELDQVTGGRGIFEAFTAEFRGKADKADTLEMIINKNADEAFGVSTLEMRNNILDKKKTDNGRKTIKL